MTSPDAVSGPDSGNAGAPDGLDAAFSKAYESVQHNDDEFVPAVSPIAKPAKAKTETPPNSTVTENAAPAPSGDEDEQDEAPAEGVPPEAAAPALAPPAHWDAAKREAFGKLAASPEAQKVVLDLAKDLEAGFTKKSQELSEDRKFAQGIKSLITDGHREQLRRAGMDEVGGIRHLFQLQDFATRDGPGYVRWVVQQMGVDPRQIFPQIAGDGQQPQPEQVQPPADPFTQQILETLQQVSGRLSTFERSQAETQNRSAERAIDAFRNATNETGQPLHPHLDKVERDMTWILQSDPEIKAIDDLGQRLKRAYDLAVYRDPEIKNQIFESEVQSRLAATTRQQEVARARRAKAPVNSSVPVSASAKPRTLEEAARQAMTSLGVS